MWWRWRWNLYMDTGSGSKNVCLCRSTDFTPLGMKATGNFSSPSVTLIFSYTSLIETLILAGLWDWRRLMIFCFFFHYQGVVYPWLVPEWKLGVFVIGGCVTNIVLEGPSHVLDSLVLVTEVVWRTTGFPGGSGIGDRWVWPMKFRGFQTIQNPLPLPPTHTHTHAHIKFS